MNTHYKWSIPSGISFLIVVLWYNTGSSLETSALANNLTTENQAQAPELTQELIPNSASKKSHSISNVTDPANPTSPFQDFSTNPPKYLSDTELRGQLTTLADGSLVITDEIRKRFDYFYMMTGDRSQQEINAIIVDHIRHELSEPAQSQALELLQQYTDYLNEYNNFSQGLDIQMMQDDPQWIAGEINNLRIFHLGAEISEIFFGQQENLRSNYLQQENSPLSAQALENQNKTLRLTNLQQQTATLKANNADKVMIHNMRVKLVGEEAANRLSQLDADRQKWLQKQQDYQTLKAQWGNVAGLSDNDKTIAFEKQAMQDLDLTDSELKRLKALDYIQSKRS